jgi:3-isopropylmalate/(R)-2-methylmalate dehydratase small subunit
MAQFTTLTSRVVVVPQNDIDTDQIIPARFLKTTDKHGLGASLFADWRYAEGGCGSSREHAPWALTGFGFRAVVSTSFADIFRNNALKNGLLPVAIDAAAHASLLSQLARDPEAELTVDLASQTLRLPDGTSVKFPIDPFARTCLLEGVDELGYILRFEPRIAEHEKRERERA